METRKTLLFYYLLVVTKRRCGKAKKHERRQRPQAASSTASPCCALGVPAFRVTSWCAPRSNQETRPDVPSGTSLRLPRYIEQQERSHITLKCSASSAATTRGRRRKQNRFCLKFSLTGVRRRWQKLLLLRLRAFFVLAFLFKTPTQMLKMLTFAKK